MWLVTEQFNVAEITNKYMFKNLYVTNNLR